MMYVEKKIRARASVVDALIAEATGAEAGTVIVELEDGTRQQYSPEEFEESGWTYAAKPAAASQDARISKKRWLAAIDALKDRGEEQLRAADLSSLLGTTQVKAVAAVERHSADLELTRVSDGIWNWGD